MILHFVTDENFTDYAISHFSNHEIRSEFVLIPSNGTMNLVHQINRCRVVRFNSPEWLDLLAHIDQYSAIVLHGMHWGEWESPLLRAIPNSVKIGWVLWGGDIYARHDIFKNFYAPKTKFLCLLHNLRKMRTINTKWEIPLDLFKRIDYILADEAEEVAFVNQYTGCSMKPLWYAYFSIEDTIGNLMNKRVNGGNIWLGNAAEVCSNHLDGMAILKRYGINNRHVITPLVYSTPWVRNRVMLFGKWLFGEKFRSISQFLPREDYNKLMLSCGTMIMPQYQPMGHGNILTGLWLGMRVYMSEKSMAFTFFKRIGIHVFSLESDFKKYKYTSLTDAEVEDNRMVLMKWYGKEHIMESVKKIEEILDIPNE